MQHSTRHRKAQRRALLTWFGGVGVLALSLWSPLLHGDGDGALPAAAETRVDARGGRAEPPLLNEGEVAAGLNQRHGELELARDLLTQELSEDLEPDGFVALPGRARLDAAGERRTPGLPRPGELPPGIPASLAN